MVEESREDVEAHPSQHRHEKRAEQGRPAVQGGNVHEFRGSVGTSCCKESGRCGRGHERRVGKLVLLGVEGHDDLQAQQAKAVLSHTRPCQTHRGREAGEKENGRVIDFGGTHLDVATTLVLHCCLGWMWCSPPVCWIAVDELASFVGGAWRPKSEVDRKPALLATAAASAPFFLTLRETA